jgi:rRNA-processing protein FCF1
MKKIILDTNFIISCLNFKIDFISETKKLMPNASLNIMKGTIHELKNKKLGNLALQIIEDKKINIIDSENYVDRGILNLEGDYIIATNDKELINKVNFPVIRIKQKKYLILDKS